MIKSTKIVILIFLAILFTQSCKDPSIDFKWFLFEAEGSYSSENDTSYIKLNAWVEINQSTVNINPSNPLDERDFITASVEGWSFQISENDSFVLGINNINIDLGPEKIFRNIAIDQSRYLWVTIESEVPLSGDIYNGKNPDTVQVEMTISDNEGRWYTVFRSIPFDFGRN